MKTWLAFCALLLCVVLGGCTASPTPTVIPLAPRELSVPPAPPTAGDRRAACLARLQALSTSAPDAQRICATVHEGQPVPMRNDPWWRWGIPWLLLGFCVWSWVRSR